MQHKALGQPLFGLRLLLRKCYKTKTTPSPLPIANCNKQWLVSIFFPRYNLFNSDSSSKWGLASSTLLVLHRRNPTNSSERSESMRGTPGCLVAELLSQEILTANKEMHLKVRFGTSFPYQSYGLSTLTKKLIHSV